ncbi:MAG: ABC transporter ATP-binding protein [bacterium]|nr:ABC transporter ATP-binding protein [bacterium]
MKNIVKIIRISKPLYPLVAIIAILIVFSALLDLVAPILSKSIVDQILLNIQSKKGNFNTLMFLIVLSFGMSIFGTLMTAISDRLGDLFGAKLRKFLTEKFYIKVLELPQSYFDSEISGKIVNQLSRGIVSIQAFINTASNFILPTILQTIFTIVVMAYFNIYVALFTLALFPIYLSLSYWSTKKWGEEEIKKNKIEDYTRGRIQEVISNIKLVKSFLNEKKEYDLISTNLEKSNEIYRRQSNMYHIFDFLRNLSLQIILAIINIIIFISAFRGTLSIGEMVLIIQLVNQVRRPLFAMSYILTQIQMAESGSKEFFEILELPSKEKFETVSSLEKLENPSITFAHVDFNYEKSKQVLSDISFEIRSNEKIALVGHSGVGKSTIVNLILKFYEPTGGKILMDHKKYSDLTHTSIRNNIALVFQENELFSSTVKENVEYGGSADDKEIIKVLKLANAYEFVKALPKGIYSEVGERGVRLSGGQKQRIQIARAILKNSPILILDEATSSLDSRSEKEVQDALQNLMKDKLVIIIAHRFSTIQNVDKIIVLDDGKVVDHGSPHELSSRPGIYKDLLTYQIEGNKKLLEQFEIY